MNEPCGVGRLIRRHVAERDRAEWWRYSQATLARGAGITQKHMSQLVQGAVPLSIDVALRLEAASDYELSAWEMLTVDLRERLATARTRPPGRA